MADPQVPTTAEILRKLLVPAALMFALPLLSLAFSSHTLSKWDAAELASMEANIATATISPEERAEALEFVRKYPVSAICTGSDPETAQVRENSAAFCGDVRQFFWATRAAQGALALGILASLVMGASVLMAFSRRSAQLASLRFGWNGLQILSALQIVIQGVLVVWLSFWITAEWFGVYVPKLIILVAILAGLGVWQVVKVTLTKPSGAFHVDAEVLAESDAPDFWRHLRKLAGNVGTAPPDNVLVGIDDNFFVTEGAVTVGETVLTGRTLFVSLSLLRQLEVSEADAVLVHELGHLLGGDTGHNTQLSPYLQRFDQYLVELAQNPLTLPVQKFMRAYATLFHMALSKSSREAELAADALAVSITSAADLSRSLVKISAFSAFRAQTENALFGQDRHQAQPELDQRLATGFHDFARSDALEDLLAALDGVTTPHPFDSHPPTLVRMEAGGMIIAREEVPALLQREVKSSWLARIPVAEAVEKRMWAAYNEQFSAAHQMALAYRYLPDNDEERAHVEEFFPPVSFEPKDEKLATTELDCVQLTSPDLEEPLLLQDVVSASVEERLLKKYLDLKRKSEKKKVSLCLSRLKEPDAFMAQFERYLSRSMSAVAYREEQDAKDQEARAAS